MDGVITLTMPYHCRAWTKVFADEGIHLSRLEIYSREGQKGIVSILEIFKKYKKPITLAKAKKLILKKESMFKGMKNTPFVPGARSFIRKCHRHGIKLGLVTGTTKGEINKILPVSLIQCFNVIIGGDDVRNGKPHPEPYQKALKKLNVSREEAVVIENAPFGIASAVKAGIPCIALETSLPKPYLKDADHIVQNYKQLTSYMKRHYAL
jgi:beta-phosphoglucomutase